MMGNNIWQLLLAAALVASAASYKADKVLVGDYDEAFCPACREFMTTQLAPVYRELKDIMEVHLNAYGWATDVPEGEGYVFDCQHGPEECDGNQILACADKYITDRDLFVDYVDCFMGQPYIIYRPWHDGEKCAGDLGVDWPTLETCAKSIEGQQLHHDYGVEFSLLDPQPWGVPHITINGEASDPAYEDLKKVVCEAYEGPKPAACP